MILTRSRRDAGTGGSLNGNIEAMQRKVRVEDLGLDLDAQTWHRSGDVEGAIEVAFVTGPGGRWALMRIAGDAEGRVLVYTQHEWECFVDGAKKGEFDDDSG
jgi:hypothetical protein